MGYRANIWKLFVYRFFYSLIPAYVIERLYWEEKGMTIHLVVYTEIIFAITVMLLEVPTGIIADKWGRKKMIVLGAILEGLMFIILLYATEFWHFASAIFLAGIARSASSGSENALLYDSLMLEGLEQDFEKYLGWLNVLDYIAIIIAALCGSFLANWHSYELNYWISFTSMVVTVCASILLIEPTINSKLNVSIAFKEYVKSSFSFFRNHPGVCIVVLSGMVTGAAINFIDEFWQLYLDRLEIPIIYFGLISAIIMLVRLPGNMIVHSIKNRFTERTMILIVLAINAIGFLYVMFVKDITGLVAIFLICFVSGIMEPLTVGYLHHRIHSSLRATIDSFQSLGLNAILIISGLGFGYFSVKYDVYGGYGFIAFICLVFFAYFFVASKKTIK